MNATAAGEKQDSLNACNCNWKDNADTALVCSMRDPGLARFSREHSCGCVHSDELESIQRKVGPLHLSIGLDCCAIHSNAD